MISPLHEQDKLQTWLEIFEPELEPGFNSSGDGLFLWPLSQGGQSPGPAETGSFLVETFVTLVIDKNKVEKTDKLKQR